MEKKKKKDSNLFFKINDKSVVKSVDFLEEIGTLCDLLIFLLDNSMRLITSTGTQTVFFENNNCIEKNYFKHEN